jgi:hypothetical protein
MGEVLSFPSISFVPNRSAPFLFYVADGSAIFAVPGNPENNVIADKGSLALDTTNGVLYLKTTDAINTGWVSISTLAIGSVITGATQGSILFAGPGGIIAQDNANLQWDDTNNLFYLRGLETGIAPTRTTANFNKTDITLTNITGLTFNVTAGKKYRFRFKCNTTLAVGGGEKYAIAGTCTATDINYSIVSITTAAAIPIAAQHTALGGNSGNGGYGASIVVIEGAINVNAGGTLTVQFAQSTASGTSTILPNSTFEIMEMAA